MKALLLVFLLTDLLGSEEVHIMSKISVQKGQTVLIPCLYDANFVSFPKYLSHGTYFSFSFYIYDRLSILDYKTENFFTAILKDVEMSDSGSYWCGVELSGRDHGTKLVLEVKEGKTKPYVSSQNVTGYEGGSITIRCYAASKWCKIGGSCAEEKRGTLDKTKVDISGDDKVLKVTLKALKREDAGWYFCSDGESQMPVYIFVGMSPYSNYTSVYPQTSSGHKQFLWLVILVLSIIICVAVVLLHIQKRKQRAAASNIYECMNGKLPQERNHGGNAHEDTYEVMNRIKCNIKQTVKDDKNIYASVVKKVNII